ncbi:hypothetical protein LGH82_25035 [Mesorhizobium sp. PAMC28654]|uniref:hypothetical protein n=1 Tax=Mesorhizobium sp. PAMC28654 TaxID=2880934 RepID=UPI001D09F57D|nr:hypothetical protein [Mesorhizobium sp. PAMC28654]UDL88373.1 hypothetical protein LGH82_25035 [Mesorhizobium sp. PAMC28654]
MHKHADRRPAVRADDNAAPSLVGRHVATVSSGPATAADRDGHGAGHRKREPAIAATAADRLRQHADCTIAAAIITGDDLAADIGNDRSRIAATGAIAAHGHDTGCATTVTAAAADRFHQHADRANAIGRDLVGIGRRGVSTTVAVGTGSAPAEQTEGATAITAGAADGLHDHAGGIVPVGGYDAGVLA